MLRQIAYFEGGQRIAHQMLQVGDIIPINGHKYRIMRLVDMVSEDKVEYLAVDVYRIDQVQTKLKVSADVVIS